MASTTNFGIETPTVGGYRNTWGGTLNTGLSKMDELLALALPIGTIQMYPLSTAPTATTNGGTWLVCDASAVSRTVYSGLFGIIGTTYGVGDGSSTFNLPDMRTRVPVGYSADTVGSGPTQRTPKAMAASSGEEDHILSEAELAAHSHAIPATTHDHDIDPVTHSHVGVRTDGGAGTEDATLTVTDDGHTHPIEAVKSWGDSSAGYHIEWGPGPELVSDVSESSATGISIADHKHTFTTNAVGHGITTTKTEVIGITSTAPDTGSDTKHNNMQPYLVLNYIILAKHPSF
jgi:microcystin-dependent protein